MSSVSVSSIFAVPCTTGDMILFIVPNTTVGKNMMHKPIAKGRSMGNTSIGSALASDYPVGDVEQRTQPGDAFRHARHVPA